MSIFHAGTARTADGTLVTLGGRVFAVTAVGRSHGRGALGEQRGGGPQIQFAGKHFRSDIGWREPVRDARAT